MSGNRSKKLIMIMIMIKRIINPPHLQLPHSATLLSDHAQPCKDHCSQQQQGAQWGQEVWAAAARKLQLQLQRRERELPDGGARTPTSCTRPLWSSLASLTPPTPAYLPPLGRSDMGSTPIPSATLAKGATPSCTSQSSPASTSMTTSTRPAGTKKQSF